MSYNPSASGTDFKGSSRSISTNYTNATGATLPMASVVSANASGQIILIDLTSDISVGRFLGLTSVLMPAAASGGVINAGRVENVTTSFAIGDALYVNYDGTLTNLKPDYGVGSFAAGYYVIFVGVVVKNEFNSSLKDIQLMPQVIGQL